MVMMMYDGCMVDEHLEDTADIHQAFPRHVRYSSKDEDNSQGSYTHSIRPHIHLTCIVLASRIMCIDTTVLLVR